MEKGPEQKQNRQERINEIENYIQEYHLKYTAGENSLGQSTQGTNLASAFWGAFNKRWMQPVKDILENKLTGKNLIDLGTGYDWRNFPRKLEIPHLKSYAAVDIELPSKEMLEDCGITKDFKENGIESSFVEEDMLKYVSRLPDNSSNFFLSAIDDDVILDDKYWKYLCEEIYRTTENKGIVIDAGVGSIGFYLKKYAENKFKQIYNEENRIGYAKIFEKNN